MINYYEYIQSELWKMKSRTFIEHAGCCDRCRSQEDLNCHHLNYGCLGNETEKDIVVLCKRCHWFIHSNKIDYEFSKELLTFKKDIIWKSMEKELSLIWKTQNLHMN